MRLTAELLRNEVEQRTNPLRERELCLRGFGIAILENLGAIPGLDQLDCWDLSHNRLSRLENFPQKLPRLQNLQCADNAIESLDVANLAKQLPNLQTLNLSYNRISNLHVVASLRACTKLEFLFLNGNPVTRRQSKSNANNSAEKQQVILLQRQEEYYRLYTIHNIPSLKVLDYVKIKQAERAKAERFSKSAAGKAFYAAARQGDPSTSPTSTITAGSSEVKTFVPGEGTDVNEHDDEFGPLVPAGEAVAANDSASTNKGRDSFTDEQKQVIRQLLASATSVKEMEEIEGSVKRGILPPAAVALLQKKAQDEETTATGKRKDPPPPPPETSDDNQQEQPQKQQKVA